MKTTLRLFLFNISVVFAIGEQRFSNDAHNSFLLIDANGTQAQEILSNLGYPSNVPQPNQLYYPAVMQKPKLTASYSQQLHMAPPPLKIEQTTQTYPKLFPPHVYNHPMRNYPNTVNKPEHHFTKPNENLVVINAEGANALQTLDSLGKVRESEPNEQEGGYLTKMTNSNDSLFVLNSNSTNTAAVFHDFGQDHHHKTTNTNSNRMKNVQYSPQSNGNLLIINAEGTGGLEKLQTLRTGDSPKNAVSPSDTYPNILNKGQYPSFYNPPYQQIYPLTQNYPNVLIAYYPVPIPWCTHFSPWWFCPIPRQTGYNLGYSHTKNTDSYTKNQ